MGSPRAVPVPCASTESMSETERPAVGQCLSDDLLLGLPARRRQSVAGAVLVDGGASDHRQYLMATTAGIGQSFEYEDSGSLGPRGAVGGVGERLAAAVPSQSPLAG